MFRSFINASAALALGGLAFAGSAQAVSPLAFNDAASLVVPVGDVKNEEVWHDLRPDVTPPSAAVGNAVGNEGEAAKGSAVEPPKEEGGAGNVENEEVWHDLRPNITPPPAAVGN